jgi:uncharacterized protein
MYVRPLSRLGGPNHDKLPIADDPITVEGLYRYADDLGLNTVHDNDVVDHVCYAAKMNSYVIRADGSLSKCTVALYDPRNIIGRLNEDGTMEISTEKVAWWNH